MFPSLVYRCPGDHFAHDGCTYKWHSVNSQDEMDRMLSDGWHETLIKAVDVFKNPVKEHEEVDNSPMSREEIEAMAKELDIKFDGRTGDKKLLAIIDEKLKK